MRSFLLRNHLPYEHWLYKSQNNQDTLRIVPERGGIITSWVCNGREMLYFDNLRFQDPEKSIRGGIPILFPICGNLPDNKIIFNNKIYMMNQHGFARDSIWSLSAIPGQNGVRIKLRENNISLLSYPFTFRIILDIRLRLNALEIIGSVENTSQQIMPFSFGLHPYFAVKDLNKVTIKGLPSKCVNQKNMKEELTNYQLDQLSNGVDFLSGPVNSSFLIDQSDDLNLQLNASPPLDFNVVWTDPPRHMVCLEPWTSPRNALMTGKGAIHLQPGQKQLLKCQLIVKEHASSN